MRKLKKSTILSNECIHCKYYERWSCKLNKCYLQKDKVNAEIDNNRKEAQTDFSCDTCAYRRKNGICVGYCMQKVVIECKEIWNKNKKIETKNIAIK